MQLLIRYVGLARQLAGIDEERISISEETNTNETTLDRVIEQVCKIHQGELAEMFASKGGTSLGQMILEVNGESVRIHESKSIKIQESMPVSISIIPTIVGG